MDADPLPHAEMRSRGIRSLLWWVPVLILAGVAGIMPDTFLDSPNTTMPHEAAFAIRFWIIILSFAYIALVVAIRVASYLGKLSAGRTRRGFPVIAPGTPGQGAG